MMKVATTKAEWASLSLAGDGSAVVCAMLNGAPHCVRFGSLDQLGQAINIRKVSIRKWTVAVPRSSCILKQITLPASDMDEASKMIEFELPSLIPLPVDEVVYGSTPLSKQGDMLEILICILKSATLNEYLEPFGAVGIEPHKITLSSLAIQHWFGTYSAVGSEPTISVLADTCNCMILTCIGGNLHRASELALSGQDVTAASTKIVEQVMHQRDELSDSLRETTAFALAGSKEYVSKIRGLLCAALPESAVGDRISVVPSPAVSCQTAETGSENGSDRFVCEAAVTMGLLEAATSSKLQYSNLLPRHYTKKHQQKALLTKYLLTGALSAVFVLFVWLVLVAIDWRTVRMSRVLESQIAPIKDTAGAVDSKRQRVRAIQKQLSTRGRIAGIMDELYRYTPKGISISALTYVSSHDGASVEIKGQADVMSAAWGYSDAMGRARLLGDVLVGDVQMVPRPSGGVVVFKANCDIADD